jgi:hypothetical protein
MPLTPEEALELSELEQELGPEGPETPQNAPEPSGNLAEVTGNPAQVTPPPSNLTLAEELELEDLERDEKESAVEAVKQAGLSAIAPVTTPIQRTAEEATQGFEKLLRGLSGDETTSLGIESIVEALPKGATPGDFIAELGRRTADRGGDILFGFLQNAFAPITGPSKAIGEGAQKVGEAFSRDIGQRLPVEIQAGINALFGDPETFGTAAELTSTFILPTKTATSVGRKVLGIEKPSFADPTAFKTPAQQQVTKTLDDLKKQPEVPPKLEQVKALADDLPKELKRDLKKIEPGFEQVVSTKMVDEITEGATQALRGNLDDSKRLFKNVSDALRSGELAVDDVPVILEKFKLTPAQFAAEFSASISKGARDLQKLSALRQKLGGLFEGDAGVAQIINTLDDLARQQPVSPLYSMVQRAENFRRAALVSQPMTAVRNAVSQTGRMSIAQIDEALQASIRKAVVPPGSEYENVRQGINMFSALMNRFSGAKRARFLELLESDSAALARARLMSQPVQEITLGSKISNGMNVFNRAQEFFFRRAGMEAKLRQLVARAGKEFDTIHPEAIPSSFYEEASRYGLEMAFASSPKSVLGREMIRTLSKFPFTVLMPFPRFVFGNAVPFVMEHSPLGFYHALKPSTLRLLASGKPDVFAKAASRATMGTIMWDAGMRMRQSHLAGEKWFEVKIEDEAGGGSKVADMRSFAPLTVPLFVGELINNPSNIKPKDVSEVTIGLNRIQGTGLELVDIIRQDKLDDVGEFAEKFLGAYLSSFATPLRSAKDLASLADPDEGLKRATREDPLADPFLNAIPGFAKKLPELKNPTTTEKQRTIGLGNVPPGITRQLLGLNVARKSRVQRELDRVQFEPRRMFPKTGIPEADNTMAGIMAHIVEADNLMSKPEYNLFNGRPGESGWKRAKWALQFERARSQALRIIGIQNPSLFLRVKARKLDKDLVGLIEKETGLDLRAPDVVQQLQGFVSSQAQQPPPQSAPQSPAQAPRPLPSPAPR